MKYLALLLIIPFLGKRYQSVRDLLAVDTAMLYGDSLYVGKTEVTNKEYLEFTKYVQKNYPALYSDVLPNSSRWENVPNKPKAYEDYYFKHPAYKNYPVVNITNVQAVQFCDWKAAILNEQLKKIPLAKRDSIKLIRVRLPNRKEWRAAALGTLPTYSKYTWEGTRMRGENGLFKCRFRYTKGEINVGKKVIKAADDLLSPVNAFEPNSIGLYNICGNVAELLHQDSIAVGGHWKAFEDEVTVNSFIPATKESPMIGFRYVVELVK
ncbi:MAG: formylglycine-generating enzyme family protein [Flavobacteriales bacterium]|jgi:formylglycine-generating enzyme required for sulfatase activity|nr:formylglycine-generating enzyme family protein [Flavobacteriales bacterium]